MNNLRKVLLGTALAVSVFNFGIYPAANENGKEEVVVATEQQDVQRKFVALKNLLIISKSTDVISQNQFDDLVAKIDTAMQQNAEEEQIVSWHTIVAEVGPLLMQKRNTKTAVVLAKVQTQPQVQVPNLDLYRRALESIMNHNQQAMDVIQQQAQHIQQNAQVAPVAAQQDQAVSSSSSSSNSSVEPVAVQSASVVPVIPVVPVASVAQPVSVAPVAVVAPTHYINFPAPEAPLAPFYRHFDSNGFDRQGRDFRDALEPAVRMQAENVATIERLENGYKVVLNTGRVIIVASWIALEAIIANGLYTAGMAPMMSTLSQVLTIGSGLSIGSAAVQAVLPKSGEKRKRV